MSIDIDDDGKVSIFSPNVDALDAAKQEIKTAIADVEVGVTYKGKVIKLVDFGAFINLLPGKDGLLHISQITKHRSQKVAEFLKEGDEVTVFVADVDKQGRVKLEWRRTEEQQAAYDASAAPAEEPKKQEAPEKPTAADSE